MSVIRVLHQSSFHLGLEFLPATKQGWIVPIPVSPCVQDP